MFMSLNSFSVVVMLMMQFFFFSLLLLFFLFPFSISRARDYLSLNAKQTVKTETARAEQEQRNNCFGS
jgi:hypothetical protein